MKLLIDSYEKPINPYGKSVCEKILEKTGIQKLIENRREKLASRALKSNPEWPEIEAALEQIAQLPEIKSPENPHLFQRLKTKLKEYMALLKTEKYGYQPPALKQDLLAKIDFMGQALEFGNCNPREIADKYIKILGTSFNPELFTQTYERVNDYFDGKVPAILRPDDEQAVQGLQIKLKEYKERLNEKQEENEPFKEQLSVISRIAILKKIIEEGCCYVYQLSSQLAEEYGDDFDVEIFDRAADHMEDYCLTQGKNLTKHLPDPANYSQGELAKIPQPDDPQKIQFLQNKLEEYNNQLLDDKDDMPFEERLGVICKIAILKKIIEEGCCYVDRLLKELTEKYGNDFDVTIFNKATKSIEGYCITKTGHLE